MDRQHLPRAALPRAVSQEQSRLLFVSTVATAQTGNGLAMRAGATLRALASAYRVTLLIVPHADQRAVPIPDELAACCERVVRQDANETLSPDEPFDVVHVFRLAAWPGAEPWLRQATERHLDLVGLDSASERRLAVLAWADGKEAAARRAEAAATEGRRLEGAALGHFDRIYVSSDGERQALLKQATDGAEVVVLPKTLPLPVVTPFLPPDRGPFVLLFTGTLDQAPNVDAMHAFCSRILPRIQAGADRPVTLRIVGTGAAAVQRLDGQAGVEVIGAAADIAPWYRDAHLAVAPMRTGSGMRTKVLEAFAHQRPVVATPLGMAGIAAENGRHAFIADAPGTFSAATLRLLHDPELAARMAGEAFALFSRAYTDETLARIISALASLRPRRVPRAAG